MTIQDEVARISGNVSDALAAVGEKGVSVPATANSDSLPALIRSISTGAADQADYVVEQGTSGIWTYRKWQSGIAECWCERTGTDSFTTEWGNIYIGSSTKFPQISYPFAFAARPIETATIRTNAYAGWVFSESNVGINTTTKTAAYNFARPTSATSTVTVYLHIDVKGRWK